MDENHKIAAMRAGDSDIAGESPLVSIVIACFNQGHFLAQAINSALAQTWRPLEVVVVDDGSTDDTPAVIARYPDVVNLRQANQGVAAARNAGLRASRGRYILFLDSDDFLVPEAIELGMRALTAHPEYAFVSGEYCKTDEKGVPEGNPVSIEGVDEPYLALLRGCYIMMPATVLYRRDILEQVGGFDLRVRTCEDYDLYLKIARQFPAGYVHELMAYYRKHGDSATRNMKRFFFGALEVLERQRPYFDSDVRRKAAYRKGVRIYSSFYFGRVFTQSFRQLRQKQTRKDGLAAIIILIRHPLWAWWALCRKCKLLLKRAIRKFIRLLPASMGKWIVAHRPGRSHFSRV